MNEFIPTYRWNLTDLDKVKKNGLKVFSCFACGGGSTMGYKLAGFDVIGANEIDPEMAWHYQTNHNPKYFFVEDIRKFRLRTDLPKELYHLDILDGSPPCSSFSMAGSREKGWGKNKVFREGQSEQILDDLFFDFIELANKLKPKVVIAENVKGMLAGNAKGYVKQIIGLFNVIGYDVQLFLLNAASMGVPQKRERVFFICRRKDLGISDLKLFFNEKPISYSEIETDNTRFGVKQLTIDQMYWWSKTPIGKSFSSIHPKKHWFNSFKLSKQTIINTICGTMRASSAGYYHYKNPRHLNIEEYLLAGSFPIDYQFKISNPVYLVGMSVPPIMTYKIADQIYKQWFAKMEL